MFKTLKNELYDIFQCTNKDCPANCCDEDWVIIIDNDAYQRIKALGQDDIDEKITKEEPHVIIKRDHKCPFITKTGLCTIHAKYGPDYLSNTCKSYPRFVSAYGNVYTMTLGISCPEVARLVIELDRPVQFVEDYHYEDPSEIGRRDIRLPSESILEKLFIFLDGSISISEAFVQMDIVTGNEDSLRNRSIPDIMAAFREKAISVRESSLLDDLDGEKNILTYDRLLETERLLELRFPLLPINVVRNYLFERIFYRENDPELTYSHILKKAKLELILFLGVLTINGFSEETDIPMLTEWLYRTMRVADHSENVLEELLSNNY